MNTIFFSNDLCTYEIKLSNGVILKDLSLNGNNFVSSTPILEEMFVDGLSSVEIISSDGQTKTLTDATLVQIVTYQWDPGKYYFVIAEIPSKPTSVDPANPDLSVTTIQNDITNLQIAIAEVYEMLLS